MLVFGEVYISPKLRVTHFDQPSVSELLMCSMASLTFASDDCSQVGTVGGELVVGITPCS